MSYVGDIHIGDTIDVKFCTVQATGAPTTLSGVPVISAYIDNGTTEITAGITLSVDFDSRTGLNNVRVVATVGNGYAAGTNVDLVITTGTVNSVSAVGYVVGSFSIDKRGVNQILGTAVSTPATAGVLDVNVKNINNVSASPVTTIKAVQGLTTADTIATYTGNTPQTGDAFARIGAAGVGLTNLGDTRIANLDAAVTTRMATYTQPTGFLAATFPGTVGSSTLTQTQVTGGAYTIQSSSCVLGDARIANLDATVSSRLASGSYTAPPSAADNAAAVQTSAAATPLPSNIKKINGTTVNGNGAGTPWGP